MELTELVLDTETVADAICAGCQEKLGEQYFLSPCKVKYCTEACYNFYMQD